MPNAFKPLQSSTILLLVTKMQGSQCIILKNAEKKKTKQLIVSLNASMSVEPSIQLYLFLTKYCLITKERWSFLISGKLRAFKVHLVPRDPDLWGGLDD